MVVVLVEYSILFSKRSDTKRHSMGASGSDCLISQVIVIT